MPIGPSRPDFRDILPVREPSQLTHAHLYRFATTATMPVQITFLYPNAPDASFDMDYYLSTHMPMVAEQFGPYNFKGYSVSKIKGIPKPDKTMDPSPYSVQAVLNFDAVQDFQAALSAVGEKIMSDVPNYSNQSPILLVGEKLA
jgi:uncharacterized protein (TIGR02118 family)